VDPPLAKPPEMVLMVPRREEGVGGGDVGAGRCGFLVSGLGWASVVKRVVWRASVVRSRGVAGSRGMIISMNVATKVTGMDQFFYLILECFAVFCSVAMVAR